MFNLCRAYCRRHFLALVCTIFLCAVSSAPGYGGDITSSLIDDTMPITTGFSGGEAVIFGAVKILDGDIIIDVTGPPIPTRIRRQEQQFGIWVNATSVAYAGVPGFYDLSATKPIETLIDEPTRQHLGIGINRLAFGPVTGADAAENPELLSHFRDGIIRNNQREDLYRQEKTLVQLIDQHLFRLNLRLPATIPAGDYRIRVFQVVAGKVTAQATDHLTINKVGLSAQTAMFAHQSPVLYGVFAVIIALLAGWMANWLFQRI